MTRHIRRDVMREKSWINRSIEKIVKLKDGTTKTFKIKNDSSRYLSNIEAYTGVSRKVRRQKDKKRVGFTRNSSYRPDKFSEEDK